MHRRDKSEVSVSSFSIPAAANNDIWPHWLRPAATMTGTPTVARSPASLIPPAGPTTLPLSTIDKMVAGLVNLIQVFPPSSLSAARGDQGAVVAAMRNGFAMSEQTVMISRSSISLKF